MIKALFFDIDGTLVSMKTRTISQETTKALRQLKNNGIRLFIASGRPPIQLSLLPKAFNDFLWDGYVMMNGQYCIDENKEAFYDLAIREETLAVLVPWLKEENRFACSVFEADYSYELCRNIENEAYLKAIGKIHEVPPIDDPVRSFAHKTYQFSPRIPEEKDAEFLRHAPGLKSARWAPGFSDMIPKEGGKSVGMQKMLDRFGFTKAESIAFGDGGNDIEMLEYAGIGVAMGNARLSVKERADFVTKDCEEDGLVHAFRHFGLL